MRGSIQINKIRKEKGDSNRNGGNSKIIRSFYKSLYSTKLKNLDGMDGFLDSYHIPKLNQGQVNYLNRAISCNEIEEVIKNIPRIAQMDLVQDSTGPSKKT